MEQLNLVCGLVVSALRWRHGIARSSRQYRMELQRRARGPRTRRTQPAEGGDREARHGALERRARGRVAYRVHAQHRHRARHRMPLAACRLPGLPANGRGRLAQPRPSPERLDRRRDPRHVLPAMFAAPAVREAAGCHQAVMVRHDGWIRTPRAKPVMEHQPVANIGWAQRQILERRKRSK